MPANPSELEYEVREWEELSHDQYHLAYRPGARELAPFENYEICNADSQNAQDIYKWGRAPKFLLDYELIAMGEDPLRGCMVKKFKRLTDPIRAERFLVIVFQPDKTCRYYIEKTARRR